MVSLALICCFSKMRSHLGLDATVMEDGVPETVVLAVAKVQRPSASLRTVRKLFSSSLSVPLHDMRIFSDLKWGSCFNAEEA